MLAELSPGVVLPSSRQVAAKHSDPLALRFAIPLIGSVSAGLWILMGKAVMLLAH